MSDELESALEELSQEFAESLANTWHERTLQCIQNADQGADGLTGYVTEPQESRDQDGSYQFRINHPTASLHERGGDFGPAYAKAKMMGMSRNEFYDGLKKGDETVIPKRIVRRAAQDAEDEVDVE